MPDMSGPALAQRIGELYPSLKVLYTSGHAEDALSRYGLGADEQHFLSKPFSIDELVRKVREALAG
jgi:DNA-binding NarL/FixJ family response regulator